MVCVGRLVPRKGQDRLIDALALLVPRYPGLQLALVGSGRLAGAGARARRLGVADRVHLLGALSHSQCWLAAADVFASPCRVRWGGLEVEGFGIVFAEAAAAGLPVLAGRSGERRKRLPGGYGHRGGWEIFGGGGGGTRPTAPPVPGCAPFHGGAWEGLALARHTPAEAGARYRELLLQAVSS